MITCNLTKLESAVDQIRKAYTKLAPADAALIASALSLTGRHALAVYEDTKFSWPEDNERLMLSMVTHLRTVNEGIEMATPKKMTKAAAAAAEEEPVMVNVGLAPNIGAGDQVLSTREDLKTLLADILQSGVEFLYNPTDIGWQWALDRANWNTVSGGELSRRIKIKVQFTEGAVGIETGTVVKKRGAKKEVVVVEAAPVEVAELEADPEIDEIEAGAELDAE